MLDSKILDKWSSEDDDKSIRNILHNLIDRINFFNSFYVKLEKINELPRVYDWFLYSNLLNLCKFSDAFKIQNELNEFNPFYIWAWYFNPMKHLDAEREIARNDFEFGFCGVKPSDLKYKKRREYKNEEKILTLLKLRMKFYNNISNFNPASLEYLHIDKKMKVWNEIKDFLQFILNELPEKNILDDEEGDFYKNRSHLWKFYLEKKNRK